MVWELHRLNGNLDRYKVEWDSLNSELCDGNPYFSSSFIEPLLKHFGKGDERLCLYRSQDNVDAMLIVVPQGAGKWATFLPAQAQIAPIMTRDAGKLRTLIPRLSFPSIALDCLSQDPLITSLDSGDTRLPVIAKRHALTVSVSLAMTFDQYWAHRPKKLRQNIDRRMRRAHDNSSAVRYVKTSEPHQMAAAVKRFGTLESRGWKGKSGTAVDVNNVQGRFYIDVMTRFAEQSEASVYELYFDDRLVASRLAIASEHMLVMLKTTYDEGESRLAPGRLLLKLVLEEEFKVRRCRTVEFYTSANKDLIEWSTHQRWISHYLLLRNFPLRWLYHLVRGRTDTEAISSR